MYTREGSFAQKRSFAPVKVGDILDVKIEAVGEKGDGIAKIKGFVLFVPNAKKDENLKVKVTRVLRKVGFAEVVSSDQADSDQTEDSSEPAESYGEEEEASEDSEEF